MKISDTEMLMDYIKVLDGEVEALNNVAVSLRRNRNSLDRELTRVQDRMRELERKLHELRNRQVVN